MKDRVTYGVHKRVKEFGVWTLSTNWNKEGVEILDKLVVPDK